MPSTHLPLFRQANRSDIPAMSRIRLAVTENVLSDPRRATHAMYEDYLEKSGRGWVAEYDGEIVAFCYADKIEASIWALFVAPGHEGRGLGKALLERAVAWLFEIGHGTVHLSTTAGTRADGFYAAQGWQRAPISATEAAYSLARPVLAAYAGECVREAHPSSAGFPPHSSFHALRVARRAGHC